MKGNKKSLLASGVSLLASAALLAGATFAWFTDSVTNSGNKIQAGKLAINAYAYDLAADSTDGFTIEGVNGDKAFAFEATPQNLKTDKTPIINDTLFEPGKSNAKLLKVENAGTLAAKIRLEFQIMDGSLTDALWFDFVQVKDGAVVGAFQKRPMSELETIAKMLELPLLANENVQFILVYGMNESAGNAFMEKTFSADVAILATQYTEEEDGFGSDQYDKDASWPLSIWDGESVDTSWYNEEESAFLLGDASELAGLAQLSAEGNNFQGKTITLTASMDFQSEAFPVIADTTNSSKAFKGVLNGNGYAIKNVVIESDGTNSGLFGMIYGGTIRNLEIADAVVISTNSNGSTGVVVGDLYNGTLENVKVTGDSQVSGRLRTGGVAGELRGTSSKVIGCENSAKVTGAANYTGGIAGALHYGSGSAIEDCINHGTVTGTTEVGGIVGYADRARITGCENRADVTGTSSYGTGGILGFDAHNVQIFHPGYGSTLTECSNYGTITAPNHVGGILGTFAATPGDSQPDKVIYSTLNSCVNYGNVVGNTKCGAIFGYQHTYAHGDGDANVNNLQVKMIGCRNEGTVNGAATDKLTDSQFCVQE